MGGKKFDDYKPLFDLIDPSFQLGLALTLTHGAYKYGKNNWQDVEPERYFAALSRHLNIHNTATWYNYPANYLDKDTGLLHLDHIAACTMFLRYQLVRDKPLVLNKLNKNIAKFSHLNK